MPTTEFHLFLLACPPQNFRTKIQYFYITLKYLFSVILHKSRIVYFWNKLENALMVYVFLTVFVVFY